MQRLENAGTRIADNAERQKQQVESSYDCFVA